MQQRSAESIELRLPLAMYQPLNFRYILHLEGVVTSNRTRASWLATGIWRSLSAARLNVSYRRDRTLATPREGTSEPRPSLFPHVHSFDSAPIALARDHLVRGIAFDVVLLVGRHRGLVTAAAGIGHGKGGPDSRHDSAMDRGKRIGLGGAGSVKQARQDGAQVVSPVEAVLEFGEVSMAVPGELEGVEGASQPGFEIARQRADRLELRQLDRSLSSAGDDSLVDAGALGGGEALQSV